MRGSSRFVALLGMLFAGAGFIMIIFAYDGAATHDVVSSQMPYLISGGFGGLALVVLGVALTVIHVLRQETARLATKLDESTEALAAIAAPRVGPTEVPDGDDTVVASRSSSESGASTSGCTHASTSYGRASGANTRRSSSTPAWRAGCGLIIVANKWDLVDKETGTAAAYERYVRERAPSLRWAPILFTSATTGQRVHRVLDLVLEVAEERRRRIPTHEVNEVVQQLADRQSPPLVRGRLVRLYSATQADRSPPTFVIFTNFPAAIPDNYVRFLQNAFRYRWGFIGAPIRIHFRPRKERS
jgi:hypothetical protein